MKEYTHYVKSPDGRVFRLSSNGIRVLDEGAIRSYLQKQEEKARHFSKMDLSEHSANVSMSSANVWAHETSANVIAQA